jgi:hypothetical protein
VIGVKPREFSKFNTVEGCHVSLLNNSGGLWRLRLTFCEDPNPIPKLGSSCKLVCMAGSPEIAAIKGFELVRLRGMVQSTMYCTVQYTRKIQHSNPLRASSARESQVSGNIVKSRAFYEEIDG